MTALQPARKLAIDRSDGTEESPDEICVEFDLEFNPLVPKGDHYIVAFTRAEQKWLWGKRLKMFLHFKIVSPTEYLGVHLFMAANVPQKNRWTVGYKFFRAWTLASGRRPFRRDRLSTAVFRGKYFRARVKIVETSAKDTQRSEGAK